MNETGLRQRLAELEPPPGSAERAGKSLSTALTESRGRRKRRLAAAVAALLGGLSAFSLTAPGQAAVDWVTNFVSIEASDEGGLTFANQEAVGRGEFSDGSTYQVTVSEADGSVCPGFSLDQSALPESSIAGVASCRYDEISEGALGKFSYLELRNGGVAAYGIAAPEVEEVRLAYEDGEIAADLIPLRGEVVQSDGSSEPIMPASFIVAELSPGVGDVERSSVIEARAIGSEGTELDSKTLQWVRPRIGGATLLLDCNRGIGSKLCDEAKSGELGRVKKLFATPLPSRLQSALADRGYTYTPAGDAEREIPVEEGIKLDRLYRPLTRNANGLAYRRLGRISGEGLENRLVFLFHYFAIERSQQGGGGGFTDVRSARPEVDPLEPEAHSYLFDAATGELLVTVDYP